ncbi:RAD51-associated protein 1 isoform X2 [Erinaceus europaeus]|uniref:RAD51-associated protein 1 isoform X2 n=1 Tax=Erinaceus europaeus TaxID=9365 RepID=A0ABM3XBN6_ERIEU|nr:RAD51-associated protein 1 isoform X2 [Erinaceus europaeus]
MSRKKTSYCKKKSLKKGERMALDDKLYQRDLEVALALSVKQLPTVTIDVEESPDKSTEITEIRGSSEAETTNKSPHISNCSVASDYLDLDKITEEDDFCGVQGKRKAASKAVVQQRKVLQDCSDGDSAEDTEPDFTTGEDSEEDSDFGESDDSDENFTVRKGKAKEIKKKEVKVKRPVQKKKKTKSKGDILATSADSPPAAIKSERQPSPQKVSLSSEATRRSLQICSPSAERKRPKWVPPAVSRSSSNSSSPLAQVPVKSPNQSLRLGLSRLARVKPLHPNVTST